MCTKKRFLTRKWAKHFMKEANKSNKGLIDKLTNVYKCDECGYWHMTSLDKRKSRAISRHGKQLKKKNK